MIPTLRAEFRKLLTIRSTYLISGLALLLGAFIAFYGFGLKGPNAFETDALQQAARNIVTILGTFVGITAILVICHEYRYSTISYTLTISNSRMKVLFAKLATISAYAAVMAVLSLIIAVLLTALGAKVGGHELGMQTIDAGALLWRSVAYMLGSAWLGLVLGFLSRSQVFAIVMYFVLPSIEPVIHGLLKVSSNYLPNASLNQVMSMSAPEHGVYTSLAALGVFALYMLVAFAAASALFVRKDAS